MTVGTEETPPEPNRGPLLERFGTIATQWTGRTSAFLWALLLVVGWAVVGPLFHYSDTWQLFINTVTNLVTFLMVFLIQRAQNKDTLALQLKVNELIAAQRGAHNSLINIEHLSEEELRSLRGRFARLAEAVQGSNATSVALIAVDSTEDEEPDEVSQGRTLAVGEPVKSRMGATTGCQAMTGADDGTEARAAGSSGRGAATERTGWKAC